MNFADLDLASVDLVSLGRYADGLLCRKSFKNFIVKAWPTVEPARMFLPSWHVDAIADHLQAVSEGKIRNLLINVPPGHAKSLIVSVLWPAWEWLGNPQWRSVFASYAADLAIRDSVRCRALLDSNWYQDTFSPPWKLSGDQNVKSWFENTEKGSRLSLGVGGKATGFRADCLICDDPLNARDQYSTAALDEAVFWWDQVMSSRLNDPMKGAKVIIMQRLSDRDLSAHVLGQKEYEHLNLPTEFEPDRRARTCIGWTDPRTRERELLFPALFPLEAIEQAKRDLGGQGFAAQHQQRPSPEEGGVIKRHWWNYWQYPGQNLPPVTVRLASGDVLEKAPIILPEIHEFAQSWDCAFKDTKSADYVVGQCWGRVGANRFLLHQDRARRDLPGTVQAVRNMTVNYPRSDLKLIEDKANGPAVIQTLKGELSGLVEVNPEGGKMVRAAAVSPQIESGNVYIPHPQVATWVKDFIEECSAFPNGANDDQLDSATQLLVRWKTGPESAFPALRVTHRTGEPEQANHIYSPELVNLKEWFGRWISCHHGGSSAAHWWCREPNGRIYIYREYVAQDVTAEEFGRAIAVRSQSEASATRILPVWMSREAFDTVNGKSTALMVAAGIQQAVGEHKAFLFVHNEEERMISDPSARWSAIHARLDRMPNGFLSVQALEGKDQTGWEVIRELLRWRSSQPQASQTGPDWDYARTLAVEDFAKYQSYVRQFEQPEAEVLPILKISSECKALIQAMSGAVKATDDTALAQGGGTFVLQSLRIGALASREDRAVEPMQEFVGRRLERMAADSPGISRAIVASKAEQDWSRQYAVEPISFARRRG